MVELIKQWDLDVVLKGTGFCTDALDACLKLEICETVQRLIYSLQQWEVQSSVQLCKGHHSCKQWTDSTETRHDNEIYYSSKVFAFKVLCNSKMRENCSTVIMKLNEIYIQSVSKTVIESKLHM